MTKIKECRVAASGNILTPEGILSYAQYLIEPQENQSGQMKHNLNLMLPADVDLSILKKAMGKIALDNLDGDAKRAKQFVERRFLDPNNLPGGGKPAGDEFEGYILIRASCGEKNPPQFAYPNGKQIPADEVKNELYSGRWASVSLNPYWSDNKKNPGVFLGLQNVQLLSHGENLGVAIPKAEDEFGAVEGHESSDNNEAKSADDSGSDVDDMFD